MTLMEQMNRWVEGESLCPAGEYNECCPDFSCCQGKDLFILDRGKREEIRREFIVRRVKWAAKRAKESGAD